MKRWWPSTGLQRGRSAVFPARIVLPVALQQDFRNDATTDICKPEIPTAVLVGQSGMVNTE